MCGKNLNYYSQFKFSFLLGNTPKELLRRWSEGTRLKMLKLLKDAVAPKMGISIVHGYLLSEKVVPGEQWKDEAPTCHVLTKEERKQFPYNPQSGCSYSGVMVECAIFIPYFTAEFIKKGGKILRQKVTNVKELFTKYDIVINCCGMGSRELFNDKELEPVRGQVIRVKAPWIKEFIYYVCPDDKGRVIYIFPNQNTLVLGGTKQHDNHDQEVQIQDRDFILKATQKVYPSLENAQFVCDWVGFRPVRKPGVRLEKELLDLGGTNKMKGIVIHNYGHGANGITLSWGCGEHVLELFENCIKDGGVKMNSSL